MDEVGLEDRYRRLRAAFDADRYPSAAVRADRLLRLERRLLEHADRLAAAISADFGHRSTDETRLLEIIPAVAALRHARRHVARWMRPERRRTALWFRPARATVITQPLGVVGIVVPWNYPVLLALSPLAGVIAAGNRAMVKLSEFTPRTAEVLAQVLCGVLGEDEVTVVTGDLAMARAFTRLSFDHLVFTGSTRVGREVMAAAAQHLTPVTLELGGKSPAIVTPGYPLDHAAERIAVGKCMNAGQTCVAPDYVLVPHLEIARFVAALKGQVSQLYPSLATTPDYSSIVNDVQFDRLTAWLVEARDLGAQVVALSAGGEPDRAARRFPPVAVVGAPPEAKVMREEIFGPILPVLGYETLAQAIDYINARPHPLALYLFDRDRARIDQVLTRTLSGGVTLNDTILHVAEENLPFGGVGASGMGQYHGRAGYLAFSKAKAVFRQSRWSGVRLFNPPYGWRFRALVGWLSR